MKARLLVIILSIITHSYVLCTAPEHKLVEHVLAEPTNVGPTLVAICMIKNEAESIRATLQPLADGGIKHYIILDTGSSDGTQELVRKFFKDNNIEHGHLFEKPFVDFATSRNHALEFCEQLFPNAEFMLMLDADWYLQNVEGLLKFCEKNKRITPWRGYFINLHVQGTPQEFCVPRLITGKRGVRFIGAVHEYFNTGSNEKVPLDIYFIYAPSEKGKRSSAERWKRDCKLLLKSHQEDPSNPRTIFYLAQSYACLNDWSNALKYYDLRTKYNEGCPEEKYLSWYYAGLMVLKLAEFSPVYKWPAALGYLIGASALRPHRAEPLVHIARQYCLENNMQLAYMFARSAITLPYPTEDIGFIEKDVYDFARYDVLGACALYIPDYELGEWAVSMAIKAHPQEAYLYKNLEAYRQHKAAARQKTHIVEYKTA